MDTRALSEFNDNAEHEFSPGAPVIYAMHGKCQVIGTETRALHGESIRFYKLEIKKSTFARTNKQGPAIWVPVSSAKSLGMREPMTVETAHAALKVLSSREYFFNIHEPWATAQTKIEECIRTEGGVGLAKATSYLFVLKRRQIVPSSEVLKLHETVSRLLFRELSEILNEPIRAIEERVQKGMKSKLLPDN